MTSVNSEIVQRPNDPVDVHFKVKGRVVFCLDESGSMGSHTHYAISAYNKFLDKLKNDKRVDYLYSLWKFNNTSSVSENNISIKDAATLALRTNYDPGGGTALYDTILDAVLAVGKVNPNTKVVVVVLSDGGDNQSQTSVDDVLALVQQLSSLPNWTFIYLGAYEGFESAAAKMGFQAGNMAYIDSDNLDEMLDRIAGSTQRFCLNEQNKETMLLEQ